MRDHVELGYASTVHRAQGLTADTSHVLADSSTSRALAYVAMTRGKESNRLYVETDDAQPISDVLAQIANHSDGMSSANETIRAEQARVDDLVTLVDEYRDVTERADEVRFEKITREAVGREAAQQLREDEGWGALQASLRGAERAGYDPADALHHAWNKGSLEDARNKPAVLASRIQDDMRSYWSEFGTAEHDDRVPAWIVDRGALDSHHTDPAWREHLAERYDYLVVRLEERGQAIAAEQPEWAKQLGDVPADAERRAEWNKLAAEVDAFRGRYKVDEATPDAIPNQNRERAIGAELHERVTAMHKSAAFLKEPPADQAVRAHAVQEAATATREAAQQSTSEVGKPPTAAEALRARNEVAARRAADQLRRVGRTPTASKLDRDSVRDASERERQSRARARGDDARER